MGDIKSGEHLAVVRRWMQRNAWNGETVTWGSRGEFLRLKDLTPADMDQLAQDIADAAVDDVIRKMERIRSLLGHCPVDVLISGVKMAVRR